MNYRNPKYTADGRIDCEIEHPQYGWIPFTADPNDTESHGHALFDLITKEGGIAPYDPPEPDPITSQNVKAEAYRRIIAICPEWKQRNLTAQAVLLTEKGRANWTVEEQAAWDAGEAIWTQIAAIRAASDVLEAIDPIPTDYMDDKHWM
jgi:hypothetical protein